MTVSPSRSAARSAEAPASSVQLRTCSALRRRPRARRADLEMAPGELVALLGPVGLRQDDRPARPGRPGRPRRGRILVDGKDITNVPANQRDMGMVFQAYSLFPNMTARENVGLRAPAARRRRRRPRERAPTRCSSWSASSATATATRTSSPVASSSGSPSPGRWRSSRKVLLLDEPLSALDAKVRRQLRDEIRRIQIEVGTTTLFVTHDQEEALALGDRVGVMSAGRLEQIAPPAELYDTPADALRRRVRRAHQSHRCNVATATSSTSSARALQRSTGRPAPARWSPSSDPRPCAWPRTDPATPTSSRPASSARSAAPSSSSPSGELVFAQMSARRGRGARARRSGPRDGRAGTRVRRRGLMAGAARTQEAARTVDVVLETDVLVVGAGRVGSRGPRIGSRRGRDGAARSLRVLRREYHPGRRREHRVVPARGDGRGDGIGRELEQRAAEMGAANPESQSLSQGIDGERFK